MGVCVFVSLVDVCVWCVECVFACVSVCVFGMDLVHEVCVFFCLCLILHVLLCLCLSVWVFECGRVYVWSACLWFL